MKLLFDQDAYLQTQRFLRASGHDGVAVAEIGLARAADVEIVLRALETGSLLVTRDRDFGRLALRSDLAPGILYETARARSHRQAACRCR